MSPMGETFTAVAVESITVVVDRGWDWQGWLQTLVAVVVPIAVLFYVEKCTVPRVQRTLAAEEAVRAQKLDEENARRSADLHRQALAHSERVAAEQRRAQLLFEVRRDLDAVLMDAAELDLLSGEAAFDLMLRSLAALRHRAQTVRPIAVYLELPNLASLLDDLERQISPYMQTVKEFRAGPTSAHAAALRLQRTDPEEITRLALAAVNAIYEAVRQWVAPRPPSGRDADEAP